MVRLMPSGNASVYGRHINALIVAIGLALCAWAVHAEPSRNLTLELPDGHILQLSFADLEKLPMTEFVTSTVWTDGIDHYSGVLLWDLLRHHGIAPDTGAGRVKLLAIDGYSAVIEFDEITEQAPMLAFMRNGAPMPLRSQGPFWLIFPYDDDPAFRTESIYAMSVWQVQAIRLD